MIEQSILDSVKSMVNVDVEETAFDTELIMLINSVFSTLRQIGVGQQERQFHIESNEDKWTDFIDDPEALAMIKPYIGLKVRLIFDPPQNSSLDQALRNEIAEFEWRMNIEVDKYSVEERSNGE